MMLAQRCSATSRIDRPIPEAPAPSVDDGATIVATLNDRWRVIICPDDIQWVLQRRAGERGGRARWASDSYFRTREALIAFCHARAGAVTPAASETLVSLPVRFVSTGGEDVAP